MFNAGRCCCQVVGSSWSAKRKREAVDEGSDVVFKSGIVAESRRKKNQETVTVPKDQEPMLSFMQTPGVVEPETGRVPVNTHMRYSTWWVPWVHTMRQGQGDSTLDRPEGYETNWQGSWKMERSVPHVHSCRGVGLFTLPGFRVKAEGAA